MALQTTVQLYIAPALPGLVTSPFVSRSIDSFPLASDSNPVNFGDAVFFESTGVVRGAKTGDTLANFAGFVARDAFQENAVAGGFAYQPGDVVQVARVAEIWEPSVTDLTQG